MNIKSLLTLFGILVAINYCYAELSFNITKYPGSSITNCYGKVNVTASGTAGPFVVKLVKKNGQGTISSSNVNGSVLFTDLCKENFDVIAVNKFGCDHYLGELIFDLNNNIDAENTAETREFVLQESPDISDIVISPNPFTHDFKVSLQSQISTQINTSGYNSLGELVFTKDYHLSKGDNNFNIDALHNMSNGVYYLVLQSPQLGVLKETKLIKLE